MDFIDVLKIFLFYEVYKMSYYKKKNTEVSLKKAHDKYHNKGGKEKAAKYYQDNKEKSRNKKEISTKVCQRIKRT